MYSKITNPTTGRKISIDSRLGKRILRNYLSVLKGGASDAQLGEAVHWRGRVTRFTDHRRLGQPLLEQQQVISDALHMAARREFGRDGGTKAQIRAQLLDLDPDADGNFISNALAERRLTRKEVMNGIVHSTDNSLEGRILRRVFGEPGSFSKLAQVFLEEARIRVPPLGEEHIFRGVTERGTRSKLIDRDGQNDNYQQKCIELFNIMREARWRGGGAPWGAHHQRLSFKQFIEHPDIAHVLFGTAAADGLLTTPPLGHWEDYEDTLPGAVIQLCDHAPPRKGVSPMRGVVVADLERRLVECSAQREKEEKEAQVALDTRDARSTRELGVVEAAAKVATARAREDVEAAAAIIEEKQTIIDDLQGQITVLVKAAAAAKAARTAARAKKIRFG
jgi:hypothetical protein